MNCVKKLLVIVLAVGLVLPIMGSLGCKPSAQGQAAIYNNQGVALAEAGKYDEAIIEYNKAIELSPNYATFYNNRGAAYHNNKQYDLAIADYNIAIQLDPGKASTYYDRGAAYQNNKQYDLAIADYSKAIELDPNITQAYYNRGLLYKNKGQNDLAIADFNKVLQLTKDPNLIQSAKENLGSLGQSTTIATQTTTTPINGTGIPLTIDTRFSPWDANIVVDTDGKSYYYVTSTTLMAYGGSPLSGYTWSKPTGGRFPPIGTIVDPNGVFRGTGGALAAGTYTFDVEVSDGSHTATAAFTVTITKFEMKPGSFEPNPAANVDFSQELAVPTWPLVDGRAGQPYAASLWVMGGVPPYSWFLDSDQGNFALSGLTIDMAGGIVRGTISTQLSGKTIKFRVIVKDSKGNTSKAGPLYTINVR